MEFLGRRMPPTFWIATISLGLATVAEGLAVAYAFGRHAEKLPSLKARVDKLEDIDGADSGARMTLAVAVGRIEERQTAMATDLHDIKGELGWRGRTSTMLGS